MEGLVCFMDILFVEVKECGVVISFDFCYYLEDFVYEFVWVLG